MRLDKYLKVSRLIKRRTIANDACDAGRVLVNEKPARASYEVKPGDRLVLSLGAHKLTVEVLDVNEHATKEGASTLYRVIDQG
jgi:ribosomal 50S subunit-recycling heat shock protein